MQIETVTLENFDEVLPLIEGYQIFYKAKPDTTRNRSHFLRYVQNNADGILFMARNADGQPVGFATIYYMPSSVQAAVTCVLNDLYSLPGERGRGVGVALTIHLCAYAKAKGYNKISWQTQKENLKAQRMYDFAQADKSEWITYELTIGESNPG